MKKRTSILTILSGVFTALLAVALLASVYSIAVRQFTGKQVAPVFGWSTAVVISGSMSGSIEINDMVIIHRQDAYKIGDVVTFEDGDSLLTHRIIGETPEGFVTKGDANNAPDSDPVTQDLIVGRVVGVIPGVGRFIELARSPLGMLCMVLAGWALVALPATLERQKEQKGGAEDEKAE